MIYRTNVVDVYSISPRRQPTINGLTSVAEGRGSVYPVSTFPDHLRFPQLNYNYDYDSDDG